MKEYFIVTMLFVDDEFISGKLIPDVYESYETAISNAQYQAFVDSETCGLPIQMIFDDVEKIIWRYHDNKWNEESVDDITEEMIIESGDCMLYVGKSKSKHYNLR